MNGAVRALPVGALHDPYHFQLDRCASFSADASPSFVKNVASESAGGALALAPLAGGEGSLSEPSGSFGGLFWPDALAPLPDGGLVLLDRPRGVLRRLEPCCCEFVDWPCLGGRLRAPSGIATGCGHLYVCEPGDARVLVLRASDGKLRTQLQPPPGATAVRWAPADVVVAGTTVVVSDTANGGLHVFSALGKYGGFLGGFGAVRSLAVDSAACVYVRVEGSAEVLKVDPTDGRILGRFMHSQEVVEQFGALPIRLFAGGVIDVSQFCSAAQGPVFVDSSGNMASAPLPITVSYSAGGHWTSQALDSEIAHCVWDRVVLDVSVPEGTRLEVFSLTSELDDPAELLAAVPSTPWVLAGAIGGSTSAAESPSQVDFLLRSPPGRYLRLGLVFTSDKAQTPRVSGLRIDFPRISLRRYLPAVFSADPVAADFTDRWLAIFDRGFRSIETLLDTQARCFDPLACPAEPGSQDFLSWLATWVGVTLDRGLPLVRRRAILKHAGRIFPWRGTVRGLREALYLLLGLDRWLSYEPGRSRCEPCGEASQPAYRPPRLILEHFKLRHWAIVDEARLSDSARLWGERITGRSRLSGAGREQQGGVEETAQLGITRLDTTLDPCVDSFNVYAHKMSVFVPAPCTRTPAFARAVDRLVRAERPAHVDVRVVPVEPRFRVGVQAMLGLDAVIGYRARRVELDAALLGRATVLEGAIDSDSAVRVGTARLASRTVLQ